MPEYTFQCDPERSGCGTTFLISYPMSEYEERSKRQSCPKCKKRKSVIRDFISDSVDINIDHTLGSFVDKRSGKISADEKHHIDTQNNEYKQDTPSWEGTPDGMVHKPNIERG